MSISKSHSKYIQNHWGWEGLAVGWMASSTRWTWVWANCGRQWRIGKPGVLQSMGSQGVGHDWVTEQQTTEGLVLCCEVREYITEKKTGHCLQSTQSGWKARTKPGKMVRLEVRFWTYNHLVFLFLPYTHRTLGRTLRVLTYGCKFLISNLQTTMCNTSHLVLMVKKQLQE